MRTSVHFLIAFFLLLAGGTSTAQGTSSVSKAPSAGVDHEARLEVRVKQELARIRELTAGFDQPYAPGHDFTGTLDRLGRTSPRALSLANFVITLPDFGTLQNTMFLGSQLARRFELYPSRTSAVSGYLESVRASMVNDRTIGRYDDEAIAIALQASSSRIMRLEARAASGQDAKAASRFLEFVELAHSSRNLEALMKGSTFHWDLCNALASRFIEMEKLQYPDDDDYLRAAQISTLRGVLQSSNPDEGRKVVVDNERRLRSALIAKRNQAALEQLARLFSFEGGDQRAESGSGLSKLCKPRYAPVTVGTDQYSGNSTTFGGQFVGEDCF